jgi:hypothetical protein
VAVVTPSGEDKSSVAARLKEIRTRRLGDDLMIEGIFAP